MVRFYLSKFIFQVEKKYFIIRKRIGGIEEALVLREKNDVSHNFPIHGEPP